MFISADNLKIIRTKQEKNSGTFTIEPLPQTFGATIGNALRRVLMTSIKGAAATQMKIAGANHQFTTVAGVKEDIVEISLNIKQLRFKVHGDNPVVATIEKKGKGNVTAKDLKLDADTEIMNKDQHIATISDDKTTFKMELIIEPGTGYSPMEEREKKNAKLGVITLDALFSPIVNATYEVESTRFGERVDLDKIILDIETDGSITPEKAVKEAANILKGYYSVIETGEAKTEEVKEEKVKEITSKGKAHVENIAIEELPLQTRTINALKKHGIETLKDLASKTDEELADVKNLGEKSLAEIKELLEKENLK
jgi:DNA-directed RNA polymerase subunit alpha